MMTATVALWLQLSCYALSLSYPVFDAVGISNLAMGKGLKKLSEIGFFFCLGMLGTMMGVIFFVFGKTVTKWDPEKG